MQLLVNILLSVMKYCKPELSFFIFTSYERSECFIFGVKRKMFHNEVASSEKAGLDWVKHACRRMKHFAALPQNMKHRRCGMKQSLFRLHVFFALKSRQKKWRRERETPLFLSKQPENKQDNLFLIPSVLCFTLCTSFLF